MAGWSRGTGRGLALALALHLAPGARAEAQAPPAAECPAAGAMVVVSVRKHELYLCRDGAVQATIAVALGRGGIDKRRRGDDRTPLGSYALGAPRASARFRTFIPMSYPTAAQAANGYTGGGLGIHGPPRAWRDPVAARVLDWTTGCIATGTDEEIERIAAFTREHRPAIDVR